MTEGPEGALYYVDLGYSDISGTFGVSKIRRIEFIQSDLPPVAAASASPTQGPTPLTVNFSSSGSSDPEGQPLSYSWNFGDGTTSTQANPSHTYTVAGPYQARLTVSDGVNSTLSTPIAISAGNRPVVTISSPTDGAIFRAGDVITFSGTATDIEDGTLPASAYTWNIDFLHEGHVHPGTPITGVTSGTFTIPDQRARLQRLHAISHHAHGHGFQRAAIQSIRHHLPRQGQSHLRHDARRRYAVPGRHRAHYTLHLRHAHRLQPRNRSAQCDGGNDHLQLRLLVRRRHPGPCDRRTGRRRRPIRRPTMPSPSRRRWRSCKRMRPRRKPTRLRSRWPTRVRRWRGIRTSS